LVMSVNMIPNLSRICHRLCGFLFDMVLAICSHWLPSQTQWLLHRSSLMFKMKLGSRTGSEGANMYWTTAYSNLFIVHVLNLGFIQL
jgi:hypothetical protein